MCLAGFPYTSLPAVVVVPGIGVGSAGEVVDGGGSCCLTDPV